MKKYYFMKKPEVVEAEDYENPDGYAQFHYSREERIERRRKDYTPSKPGVFPFMKAGKGKHSGSRKKFIYVIDALILIGMIFYWKNFDRYNHPSDYTENNKIQYYLKLSPLEDNTRQLYLFAKNITDKDLHFNKDFQCTFFKILEDKEDNRVEVKSKSLNTNISPNESKKITVHTFQISPKEKIKWLAIHINDKFKLYKEIK